jgi:hypothetical protein
MGLDRVARPFRAVLTRWERVVVASLLLGGAVAGLASSAYAVPSFARQTGLDCTVCHTAFPQLTPFGRYFKVHGYVESDEQSHLPPLALMVQAPTYTHTQQGQPGGAAPHFSKNDNVALNELSLFYAGRLFGPYAKELAGARAGDVLNHVGAFVQGTYDGVGRDWALDNTEIRAANTATLRDTEVVYGVYANNNPTLQDLWNTTPAWGFPYSASGLAPEPVAAPLIAGSLAQQVVGFGGYALIDQLLYAEVGGYTTLSPSAQDAIGVDPSGETEIDGFAPYWRVALEKSWGEHSLEVGTYGLRADTFPGRMEGAGHDHVTDVGVDSQYQYLTGRHDVTVLLDFIHERAQWDASQSLGLASHGSDDLWSLTATTSYLFDQKYGADVQYFITDGDSDPLLYGTRTGSPESRGWIFQLDWLPLAGSGEPSFWPKSGLKLSLQYVLYDRFDGSRHDFDGSGRDAPDNNTLYLQAWLAF